MSVTARAGSWRAAICAAALSVVALHPAPAAAQAARRDTVKRDTASEHKGHDMSAMRVQPKAAGMHHGTGLARMPPMGKGMKMDAIPGMERVVPGVSLYLPGEAIDPASLPEAVPRKLAQLDDGDTLDLTAMLVRRTLFGRAHVMYGFNGQYPGPLIRVRQQSTITVRFSNRLDQPSTVHWHGVRLDNRFDGVPGMTQDAVPPGGTFIYRVTFPDAGVYWYHPHVREDVQQALGLFGNMLVDSPDPHYYGPANREEVLMLDDLLVDDQGILPFGKEAANFAIMGRFGNLFLVNGEPDYRLSVRRGDVVRFFLTDVSSTRMYNLDIGGARLKLVAADVSKFEREEMVRTVVIAPAQRYVVEARFDSAGTFAITNRVQALNNFLGEFFPEVDTLGLITVAAERTDADHGTAFRTLRTNADVTAEIDKLRAAFNKPAEKSLLLTVNVQGLPIQVTAFMSVDTMYFPPAEWNDGMPDMNWVSTAKEVHWIMRDVAAGKANMEIGWTFRVGDLVKIHVVNDAQSMHPMSHPIHFHGQRLLVVARNGVPETNLAWRDTFLLPVGGSADVVVEMSNPGRWMAHCHIAEHLEAGMHMEFRVEP